MNLVRLLEERAAAHPERVALVDSSGREDRVLSYGELSARVGLAQSPLSQHLARLRALKLVATRRDGQMILYRLASEGVAELLGTLNTIYCRPAPAPNQEDPS